MMIKRLFEEDIQVLNMYGTNNRVSKYISNLILLKGETDKSIVIFEEFNNSFEVIYKIENVNRKSLRV